MKKRTLLAAILFSLIVVPAILAEDTITKSVEKASETVKTFSSEPGPDNVISVNTYPYLAAFFNLGYERKIINNLSARVRGLYWGLSQGGWNFYGFGGDVFFYPQSMACKGWYFGPRFDAWLSTYSKEGLSATGALYFIGGQAGYRWLFDGGFAMALSLGAMKNIAASISSPDANFNEKPLFAEVMLPTFDFELGYAF